MIPVTPGPVWSAGNPPLMPTTDWPSTVVDPVIESTPVGVDSDNVEPSVRSLTVDLYAGSLESTEIHFSAYFVASACEKPNRVEREEELAFT